MSFGTFCTDDDPGLLGTWLPRLLGDAVGVAAAGNLQTCRPYFPAALPGVIGVGAVDRGGPAWFTNFGSWVDACAPAVNVVSTFFNDVTETVGGRLATPLPGVGAVERDELRRAEGRRGDRPGDVPSQVTRRGGVAPAVVAERSCACPTSASSSTSDDLRHVTRLAGDRRCRVVRGRQADARGLVDLRPRRERGGEGFAWLGLRMPTDSELDEAAKVFDIPELAIADARHKHERPKVERHGDCLLTVVPTARYVDSREEVEFGELFFYVGQRLHRHGSLRPGGAAQGRRAELENHPDVLQHGPGAVLQAALLHAVEAYTPVVDGLENDVREVERDVFSESRDQPTRRIYFLIREVLDFLIALEPLAPAVRRLTGPECHPWVDREIVPLFRDVDEALSEILERGRTLHSLLTNALAASNTQASMRQNEDTRRISAWVAIGVIPTVVGGLFGMNLGGIPGGDHALGFVVVTAIIVVLCVVLYRRFKEADWL